MPAVYYIFLVSFLGYPVLAICISNFFEIRWRSKGVHLAVVFFGIHNVLFLAGYSLKGDYADYGIFSTEYFFFCLTIFDLLKSPNAHVKVIQVLGLIIISLGFLFGLVGIFFFIFLSMDYQADRIFLFKSTKKNYETRRYSFGGATFSDNRYTFETYREFDYLPVEHKIDKTSFLDTNTKLDISERQLKINVDDTSKRPQIVFKDSLGNTFVKFLK